MEHSGTATAALIKPDRQCPVNHGPGDALTELRWQIELLAFPDKSVSSRIGILIPNRNFMPNLTVESTASRIANIWVKAFAEKSRGKFSLTKADIRRISGREKLEESIIKGIREALYHNHNLVLLRIEDEEFFVESAATLRKWRKAPLTVISAEVNRKKDPIKVVLAVRTVLNDAAAWPFPKGTKA